MAARTRKSLKTASRTFSVLPDFAQLFRRVAGQRLPAVLDSAGGPASLSRRTLLAFDPFEVLSCDGGKCAVTRPTGRSVRLPGNPFRALRKQLARLRLPMESGATPLQGGVAIGFLGYELGRYVERLPATAVRDIALPDMHWAFYDSLFFFDNQTGRGAVHASDIAGRDPNELVDRWLRLVEEVLREPVAGQRTESPARQEGEPLPFDRLQRNFTREEYLRAVARAIEYIAAGDIFQVNLSQRLTAPLVVSPAELYLRLRRHNPAPFAAYLSGGIAKTDASPAWAVLSSSPERFLELTGRRVATRPIKGTRPRRQGDEEFNRRSRAELVASAKDAAELAMIVDLERNDLGRVCSFGSVKVVEPRTIEEYASVFHSVAQVEGHLHEGHDLVDLLRATFPGGSITGAPKVRAMGIIDELEPTCRSVYTGSIGHIGFDGRMDLNIAIRTLLADRGRVHLQVGGGIVADSTPEAEYDETLAKARSLLEALGCRL